MKVLARTLLLTLGLYSLSTAASAAVFVSVRIAPPPLPVYEQPYCPGDGYLWVPGYWAYADDDEDYYWVPGTWVRAPQPGYLWTPGYWAWGSGFYVWNAGYWGPYVGFYGGINYGFGYFGSGYHGGYWDDGHFRYNRYVNNVNPTVVHYTYNETVINNITINRVSYNGGRDGIDRKPSERERRAERERRVEATPDQAVHENSARRDRGMLASVNQGRPPIGATPRPGAFRDRDVRPVQPADSEAGPRRPRRDDGSHRSSRQPGPADNPGRELDRAARERRSEQRHSERRHGYPEPRRQEAGDQDGRQERSRREVMREPEHRSPSEPEQRRARGSDPPQDPERAAGRDSQREQERQARRQSTRESREERSGRGEERR